MQSRFGNIGLILNLSELKTSITANPMRGDSGSNSLFLIQLRLQ